MNGMVIHLFVQREDSPTLTITTDGINGILATWADSEWNTIGKEIIDTDAAAKMSHRLLVSGLEAEAIAFASLFERIGATA